MAILMLVSPVVLRHIGLSHWVLFGHTDGLAMGAVLAWIIPRTSSVKREIQSRCFGGIAMAGFLAYAFIYWQRCQRIPGYTGESYLSDNVAISLISIGFFGLIGFVVCMSGCRWLAILRNRYLISLGTISYGLYLYHSVIYGSLDTIVNYRLQLNNPWWLDVCKVVLSLAVAIGSWRLIERPIMTLKNRFQYEPHSTVAESLSQRKEKILSAKRVKAHG